MLLSRWNYLAALALASAGLASFAAVADEELPKAEGPIFVPLEVKGEEPLLAWVYQAAEQSSPYWIGVQLEPPTDILKEHLKLDGGLVAVHVFDGSPAQKAGIKANDIILKAADAFVKEPGDLLKSVDKAQEKELTLIILRGGKETTIKVVPAKRPKEDILEPAPAAQSEEKEAVKKLEAALNLYKRHAAASGDAPAVDVLRVRPGVVASGQARMHVELPKDVTVTITKEGAAPAKICVKCDGKEYETTEDKLDQLPESVRGYIQMTRAGASGTGAVAYRAKVASALTQAGATPKATVFKAVPVPSPNLPQAAVEAAKVYRYHVETKHDDGEVDSKLNQILKIVSHKEDNAIAELRKEVEQLRKELQELRQEKK